MTDTEPTLRDRLTSALSEAGAYCGDCDFEPGDTGCTDCQCVHRMYVKAVLAVVQPELDRLTAEAASLRTVARAAAVLLHDTADRASGGIAIHAGVLRGAAKAIYDLTPDGP